MMERFGKAGDGRTLVLGVGNVLWADEGAGPRLVEALSRRLDLPDAEVVDGGTQGLYLLPLVTACRRLLVFDAVKLGRPPGQVMVLQGDEVITAFAGRPLSLHQTSLQDLLAAAFLCDWRPQAIALVGIEALDTETWGGPLSAPVAAAMSQALAEAQCLLTAWGEPMVSAAT